MWPARAGRDVPRRPKRETDAGAPTVEPEVEAERVVRERLDGLRREDEPPRAARLALRGEAPEPDVPRREAPRHDLVRMVEESFGLVAGADFFCGSRARHAECGVVVPRVLQLPVARDRRDGDGKSAVEARAACHNYHSPILDVVPLFFLGRGACRGPSSASPARAAGARARPWVVSDRGWRCRRRGATARRSRAN